VSHIYRNTEKGYILILNIGILALLVLGASFIGQQMETALAMARSEKLSLEREREIADAKAQVIFLLATQPRTINGIGTGTNLVIPDGRAYRVSDQIGVRIRDVRGLLSINSIVAAGLSAQMLERLLSTYGLPNDTIARLSDSLMDYLDEDNLRRLNGAEEEEYRAAGKSAAPRNGKLVTPLELASVLGWDEIEALWSDDPITDHLSVHPRPIINPNSADWRVLVAISGAAPEIVKDLLESKRRGEVQDITSLVAPGLTGDPFAGGPLIIKTVSDELVITLFPRDGGVGLRFNVTHTPEADALPWRIAYIERISSPKFNGSWSELPILPSQQDGDQETPVNRLQLPFFGSVQPF